jgi:hypothetical protein
MPFCPKLAPHMSRHNALAQPRVSLLLSPPKSRFIGWLSAIMPFIGKTLTNPTSHQAIYYTGLYDSYLSDL